MAIEETAVLIPVPEAEDAVRKIRAGLDPEAAPGIPAHVTLLYPFVPPDRLTSEVLDRVGAVVRSVAPFDAVLTEPGWFGDTVLWVRPEPVRRFSDLTADLCAAFPECPPYAGAFPRSVPHLTVGQDLPRECLQAAANDLPRHLPIRFRVDRAVVMTGAPDERQWEVRAQFALGTAYPR